MEESLCLNSHDHDLTSTLCKLVPPAQHTRLAKKIKNQKIKLSNSTQNMNPDSVTKLPILRYLQQHILCTG